jgi:two-component system sensor histidine kinase YesM
VDNERTVFRGRGDPVWQAVSVTLAADPGRLLECSECWRRQRIDGKDYILVTAVSDSYPWRYAAFLPSELHVAKIRNLKRFTGILVAVMITTALLASFLISIRTFRPITSIMDALDKGAAALQLKRSGGGEESDEVRYIANRIAALSYTNTSLREELDRQLATVDSAQRAALDAQIQPHFLYNTLETIKWAAVELSSGENKASEMISDLAGLLRISLDGNNMLPLATELEHARLYVRLLESRYVGKFSVQWDVDGSLLAYKTVKLVLQPLIEKSIYHGLKPRRFAGKIAVSILESEGAVALRVEDDGVGIGAEALEKLRERLNRRAELGGDHIGMRNVNQRIKLVFGPQYGLSVSSEPGQGTAVLVLIPKVA